MVPRNKITIGCTGSRKQPASSEPYVKNMQNPELTYHDSMILLKNYLPTIFTLICEVGKYQKKIINFYGRRYNQINNKLSLNGEFVSQSTIFDLLWEASEGKSKKKNFLSYIDNIVKKILKEIDETKRNQVRKTCYNMIASFTKDRSEYLRYLSELCVLEKLIVDPNINLRQIEIKLPNGKSFDFEFEKSNEKYYLEVYNIDFDVDRIESEKLFKKFLSTRLESKLNSKLIGVDLKGFNFLIVSVLWGNIKKIADFSGVFESFEEYPFLSPFMMISEYVSMQDDCYYTFEPVAKFLKQNKSIEKQQEEF